MVLDGPDEKVSFATDGPSDVLPKTVYKNIPVKFFSFLILFRLEVLKIGKLAKWQKKEMSNY